MSAIIQASAKWSTIF